MYQFLTILLLACFVFVMMGAGRVVLHPILGRTALTPLEKCLASFGGGTILLYYGVFGVGIYRLDFFSMTVLFGSLAVLAGWGAFRIVGLTNVSVARPAFSVTNVLWVFCGVLILVIVLQGFAPPTNYDSLNYHLSYPKFDLEQGNISPPWNRTWPGMFFPALGGHMSRFALAIWDAGLAQMLHGCFVAVCALGASAVTLRLGYSRTVAAIAALLFILIRVVSWQGATTETDLLITGFATLAFIAYLGLRSANTTPWAVLFGIMLAGAILAKYHGFPYVVAMVPLILYDIARKNVCVTVIAVSAGITLALISPHLLWSFWHTGNPIYPLFNSIFSPGGIEPLAGLSKAYGSGHDLLSLAITPWLLSIYPTKYFDGMVLGAPYLAAFAPLVLAGKSSFSRWGLIAGITAVYYLLWFFFLSQQVRFLLPVLPLVAAMAAAGLHDFWRASSRFLPGKIVVASLCAVFLLTQMSFVGAYALLRLPVSFGLMSKEHYLTKTPTFRQARYPACVFLTENLKPGERYFSITMVSFHCPQKPAIFRYFPEEEKWWLTRMPSDQPSIGRPAFISSLEQHNIRYILVPHTYERRRNDQSVAKIEKPDLSSVRLGAEIARATKNLTPLAKGPFVALYDANEIISKLKAQ